MTSLHPANGGPRSTAPKPATPRKGHSRTPAVDRPGKPPSSAAGEAPPLGQLASVSTLLGQTVLLRLLDRRSAAAVHWAQAISHAHRDASQALQDLLAIELTIAERWPAAHAAQELLWIVHDAELLHSEDNPHPACSLCTQHTPEAA